MNETVPAQCKREYTLAWDDLGINLANENHLTYLEEFGTDFVQSMATRISLSPTVGSIPAVLLDAARHLHYAEEKVILFINLGRWHELQGRSAILPSYIDQVVTSHLENESRHDSG